MNSLFIRGGDPLLAATLRKKTKAAQKSTDPFVLEILRKHVGLEKEKCFMQEYDNLNR